MTISGISPTEGDRIDTDSSVLFLVDDTYTYLRIEVVTEGGVAYAYDSSLGGAQSGYEVSVDNSGGVDTFTITADSGWNVDPQILYVTEDETGSETVTTITWPLTGAKSFPQDADPYFGMFSATFKVTEDDAGGAANVGWIDVVGPVGGVDGISIVDLGDGKVRFTANATTNDPDAIHDNVANEISAITEKTVLHDDDIIFLEDSEDSYTKKFVKKGNMGAARNPAKLDTDYSASLLYTFEGDLTNSASTGSDYDLVNVIGDELYTVAVTDAKKSFRSVDDNGAYTAAQTPAASVAAVGEVTVQAVMLWGDPAPESGLVVGNIFQHASSAAGNERLWGLRGAVLGSKYFIPTFTYIDTGAGAVTVSDTTFISPWNTLVHMVGRREDDGAGGYDVSLWMNGVKVAEETGQLAANAATVNHKIHVYKTAQANSGLCEGAIESMKVSNVALTDAEIRIEYLKVMGMPAE